MSFFWFIMVFAENTTPRVFCNIFSVFFCFLSALRRRAEGKKRAGVQAGSLVLTKPDIRIVGRCYAERVFCRYSTSRRTFSSCFIISSTVLRAWITVAWFLPPKRLPISSSESFVSSRERNIAT